MKYNKGDRVKHPAKNDWGLGEVLADSDGEFVTIFFVDAGQKKIALKYIQPIKLVEGESAHPILDKLKTEITNQYKIGKNPKSTASHNIKTWNILKQELTTVEIASFEQLKAWCKDHEFSGCGEGFVKYCIHNGWLVLAAPGSAPKATKS